MKLALIASLTVIPLLTALPGTAVAAEAKQNFWLHNSTGFDIKEVYVSPNRSNDWEEDVLGSDALVDGDEFFIRFNRRTKTCHWDMKVVYMIDDSFATWKDIDLCTVSKITIHYNKKNDKTTAEFE